MELLVVLLGVAMFSLVAIPAFVTMYRAQQLQSATTLIMGQIRFARLNAVKEKVSYRLLFEDKDDFTSPNTMEVQNDSGGSFATLDGHDFTMPQVVDILGSGPTNSMDSLSVTTRGECTPGDVFLDVLGGTVRTISIAMTCVMTIS